MIVKRKMSAEIIVIGGGPAGVMAAIRTGLLGHRVILVEKGPSLGRKLCLSGKGRGNLTNAGDIDIFLENFNPAGRFLRNAFSRFFNRELIGFFEKQGLAIKRERQGRIFPRSDRAEDILAILQRSLSRAKVEIIYNRAVREILLEANTVTGVKLDDGRKLAANRVILATGGASFPETGSTGDGQRMAEKLGHTVIPLRPALVPLLTQETWVRGLAGLTLKNAGVTVLVNGKKRLSKIGELLFTHFGVSGPLVLSFSGDVLDLLRQEDVIVQLSVDLKPGLSLELLDRRLQRELKGNLIFKNLLKGFLPRALLPVFIVLVKIGPDKKVNQISQAERRRIAVLLKDLRLRITGGLSLKEAMVTRGGICTKEIDPQTMQSRLIKGLYFAGEVIDVDGDTGGYNLQAAFSTGYLAGEDAARTLKIEA